MPDHTRHDGWRDRSALLGVLGPLMLTVATYNIRKAIGTDRRRDPMRILDVLREVDADVVALQEADRRFGERHSAIPVDWIAEHSAYKPVDYDIRPESIGWHGNAILVRKGSDILDCAALTIPTLEPRGAVVADLRIRGSEVRIVGMHLDLSGIMRRRQVRAILGHLGHRPRRLPTVMMGDLNEWTLHGGCLREFVLHHRIAPTGRSFHSRRPMACLDRIIVSPDVTVVSCGVHQSPRAARASDHLPVWARVHVPAQ